ncbi:precorrin-2 C(20)-methyltransferase [Halodesulfovibrio marinisediminis]|uniref:Precorrin-2 C20-methyltransferase /cobalt-factor II C20-methyltransferase n=1 Tax=Halodesulfovibrio marinisediminis DSM 17456 TaxID=1121457 RepID=A0A1N6H281_9BACT|nr:precorrin-2 C(20)-methyltransferase [Halodesulfovibrio marinisediminis]SIO13802.1 precorrin-2 C20-methyltransferase /cobalt-factor II C20-methyltransferase [Halodesulfovibrio marinisediminis DSM 17456]
MPASLGTLYGIGVGPGDPDLLTIKATKVLADVDIVLAASSTKNDYSTALSIAQPHMKGNVEVVQLGFPMTRDEKVLMEAWKHNAKIVADLLKQGKSCAFLTLGDPLIYSTFGYLKRTLEALDTNFDICVVPGITSYQASAARTGTILCESGENLLLASGVRATEDTKNLLSHVDNAVILKTYKNFAELKNLLQETDRKESAIFISRLGMDGEIIARNIDDAPEKPHYFSHMIIPVKK